MRKMRIFGTEGRGLFRHGLTLIYTVFLLITFVFLLCFLSVLCDLCG